MSKKYWGLILVLILLYGTFSYYYIVTFDNPDFNWNYHELQKISKNESSFSFAVYGDDDNSGGRFDHLIKSLNEKNVLFSVDNRDLTTSGTPMYFGYFLID
ncbi:hypothetical protein [Methanobacterium sp.]|jgi:hypothetical protein|uniref:hypothetical protein n=1 Tax=Methanobacterium sp. TaxID=2164 RepID=UPI00315918FA